MKYAETDRRYFAERTKLGEKHDIRWNQTDAWPLFCGIANLSRNIAVIELVRRALSVPGDIAEFGCYRGANLLLMAKLLRILDPQGSKQVHGFESFEGLTTITEQDGPASQMAQYYKGDHALLIDMISLYDMEDEVIVHKGLIQDTLPPLMEERPELSFSLVYCDTDLYEPTKMILDRVHPRLSHNGLIVLDEWNNPEYPGETVAVREFLDRFGASYEMEYVPNTRHPNCVLRKIHA
jgi:hypothetical protein